SFLLLSTFICILFLIYAQREFKRFYMNHTVNELKKRALLFGERIGAISYQSPEYIDSLSNFDGANTDTRFTVIKSNGKVIGDSEEDPGIMENHSDRPEIIEALKKSVGVSVRYSTTLSRDLIYVAIPLIKNDSVYTVIRASVPVVSLTEIVESYSLNLLIAGFIITCVSVLISFLLSRWLSYSYTQIIKIADRFAGGNLTPVHITGFLIKESEKLVLSMNSMARQLNERIQTITIQKNEQNAIFTAMIEGVIAIDLNEYIIWINEAASEMLDLNAQVSKGKSIQEVIRNTAFQKFIQKLLEKKSTLNTEITITGNRNIPRIINVQGTSIKGIDNKTINGVLTVLHDVTHLKRLEKIRRDFVSNVSHELRTPLTSIKGFVETLLNGAKDDPDALKRFLHIIQKQVNRLYMIVEDLLVLSRLEKEESKNELHLECVPIKNIIESAIEVCEEQAGKKNITIKHNDQEDMEILVNPSIFEQALINLIDNAIKYSNKNTDITIKVKKQQENFIISVKDNGCGISSKHHHRLFERFYRVDKARSNKLGGTGLGLAIVKHIINLHGGTVSVQSKVGQGSTFTIELPDHRSNYLN
ncbi:MAG: ATP-binding protein, partial [Chitinispirillia bacterium]